MDARHASLGRRTLEEIRQKRAAERMSKTSSGPDLSNISSPSATDPLQMRKSESGNRLSEHDISGLVSQLQDMQKRNSLLEEENQKLASELRMKEVENGMLQKRLNDLEQNTVPSLRKALKDVAMEKDAAVVAREDFSAQLRTIKKRLKEAEEEQYRAEEDAAALRAELYSLQQQSVIGQPSIITSMGYSPDHMQAMEKELAGLKSQLEQESRLRQQELVQLAEEKARTSTLASQKQELEEKLEPMSKRETSEIEKETGKGNQKSFSVEDKERLEKQMHDLAVAIERLENSRKKLLMEIDSQSSEIERLFEENSQLSAANQEAIGIVAQWQNQVRDCLQQNEELRITLDRLRNEQASLPSLNDKTIQRGNPWSSQVDENEEGSLAYTADVFSLKETGTFEVISMQTRDKEQARGEPRSSEKRNKLKRRRLQLGTVEWTIRTSMRPPQQDREEEKNEALTVRRVRSHVLGGPFERCIRNVRTVVRTFAWTESFQLSVSGPFAWTGRTQGRTVRTVLSRCSNI